MTITDHRSAGSRSPLPATRHLLTVAWQQLSLRLLAATGDPIAQFLSLRPHHDVYAIHERIRAQGLLVRSRTGITAVTSRRLCDQVLRDSRFTVRDADGRPAGADALTDAANGPLAGSFLELDPPDHTRLRRLAAPAFRPRLVRGYADQVHATAARLLDRVAARDSFDLIADFAVPLPIAVISDLLGIPDADRASFNRIGLTVGQSLDGVRSLRQARELSAASQELAALFTRLAAHRRAEPGDDLISKLTAAHDNDALTSAELVSSCGLLLIAGFETTVNLIGNGTAALLAHPTAWQELIADPALAGAVVEETLRYDPPVQATVRVAREPIDLDAVTIPTGALVMPVLAAANRDPDVYQNPDRFDPHRTGEPDHLAFGSGIHYCLGAPLARLEAEIAFQLLTERLPHLRPLPGRRRRVGSIIRGYQTFPVTTKG